MVRFHLFVATVICFATSSAHAQHSECETLHVEQPLVAPTPLQLWVERLNHSSPDVRQQAVEFLEQEVDAADSFNFMIDEDHVRRIASFRSRMRKLLPKLMEQFQKSDLSSDEWENADSTFMTVASILMAMGTDAEMAIPDLRAFALDETKPYGARMQCVMTLLFTTPEQQAVGPLFLDVLRSMPAAMQQEVAEESRKFQEEETSARWNFTFSSTYYTLLLINSGHTKSEVPTLVKIATGEYPIVYRVIAIAVLGDLILDAKSAVPGLRKLLHDEVPIVRELTVRTIPVIEDDETLIPELLPFLKLDVAKCKEVEQDLKEHFQDQRQENAEWKEYSSGEIATWYLPPYKLLLQHGNGIQRRQAIRTMGHMGPNAKVALPELRRFLNDRDEDTRRMAAEAIRQIEAE